MAKKRIINRAKPTPKTVISKTISTAPAKGLYGRGNGTPATPPAKTQTKSIPAKAKPARTPSTRMQAIKVTRAKIGSAPKAKGRTRTPPTKGRGR